MKHRDQGAEGTFRKVALALALGLALGPWPVVAAPPARITSLALDPSNGTVWVGTAGGLLRSADQGRTLTPVPLPGQATGTTAVVVAPRPPGTVYVATGGTGVFRSEDGGTSWVTANTGLDGLDIRGLAVAPNDGRLHAQVQGKGLFRSFDGGRSWERVDDGPKGTLYTLASVNIPTGMGGIFLYAATDQGLVTGPD